jgi:hypothetical protein
LIRGHDEFLHLREVDQLVETRIKLWVIRKVSLMRECLWGGEHAGGGGYDQQEFIVDVVGDWHVQSLDYNCPDRL